MQEQPVSPSSACYCTNSVSGRLVSCYSKASSSLVNILTATHLYLIFILVTNLLSWFARDLLFLMIRICSSTVCSLLWKQLCLRSGAWAGQSTYTLSVSARHKTRSPGTSWWPDSIHCQTGTGLLGAEVYPGCLCLGQRILSGSWTF